MNKSRSLRSRQPSKKSLNKTNFIGSTKANKNSSFYFYGSAIMVLLICFGSLTIFMRSSIGNLDQQISSQEEQISELSKTKRTLAAKMDSIINSDYIVEDAKFKLGMIYPEEEQLVYIEVIDKTEENDVNQNVYLNPILSVLKFFNWD